MLKGLAVELLKRPYFRLNQPINGQQPVPQPQPMPVIPQPQVEVQTQPVPAIPQSNLWSVTEAPASCCLKFTLNGVEILYTMRDVNDNLLYGRIRRILPIIQEKKSSDSNGEQSQVNSIFYVVRSGCTWRMTQRWGIPVTSTMLAVTEALQHLELRQVVVTSPYPDSHHEAERVYLAQTGIEAISMRGMGLEKGQEFARVTPEEILQCPMSRMPRKDVASIVRPDTFIRFWTASRPDVSPALSPQMCRQTAVCSWVQCAGQPARPHVALPHWQS